MPFFQNPFPQEFRGMLPFGDRQYSLTWSIPANTNQASAMVSKNHEPYDFSTYNTFTINFSIDVNKTIYSVIAVNVAGASPSATLASEVVAALNADSNFSSWFTANTVETAKGSGVYKVMIKAIRPQQDIRVYITNAGAEQKLRFNGYASVVELPSYYARDTIANRSTYPDGNAMLVQLDQTDATVDQPIITAAGFDYSAMQADWQLLGGRVGLFNFQKMTIDGSNRITQIIEYAAGAKAGAYGRKINYVYSGANTSPSQITEVPYVLSSNDLITP